MKFDNKNRSNNNIKNDKKEIVKNNNNFKFSFLQKILRFLLSSIFTFMIFIIFLILFIGFAWWSSLNPSLYLDWEKTESILSKIDFSKEDTENIIKIDNVRNFKHISKEKSIPGYYNETYDLNKINKLYYIVEPFGNFNGPAHTMLSFGFSDGKYLVVSAEIRKEKGEDFDPLLGILNQYEIVYIIGDENDLIKLRTNIRKDKVMLYPIKIEKDKIKDIFLSALHRADKLSKEPEFYNTFWNTCATNILKNVNSVIKNKDDKINVIDYKIFLPGYSDKIVFERGWINTKLNLEQAQHFFNITPIANNINDNEDFSKKIRSKIEH